MERIKIAEVSSHVGELAEFAGWLYNNRGRGGDKLCFPILRDGTGLIQCVAEKEQLGAGPFDVLKRLTPESSIIVTGTVREEKSAFGGYEIDVASFEVVQRIPETDPYPITPKEHGIEFLMDHRHLWLRNQRQHSIMRIRHKIVSAVRNFFDGEGFMLVDAPLLTNLTLGTPETAFHVSNTWVPGLFGEKAYLSQSAQPYNEAAAMAFGKVYSFGPTFVAESRKTRRDLLEAWKAEPEMAFATLADAKLLAAKLVRYVLDTIMAGSYKELKVLERNMEGLGKAWVAKVVDESYDAAIYMLQGRGSETEFGSEFSGADQAILSQHTGGAILIVDRHHPSAIKQFCLRKDGGRLMSFSLLAPEGYGEIISGGERICDYGELTNVLFADENDVDRAGWYADLRKYGSVPHSGFSLHLERLVMWICGLEHVRETIPFPRMLYRLRP